MKSLIIALITFLSFASTVFAQAEESSENVKPPSILVKNESGTSVPIRLKKLSIDVQVIGNIATTTMEMMFYNDSNTVLEGELYFPLGEGQTVSRFAMDVNGSLREGVVVEKNKGQAVFESVVRKNVDPGLLEWTEGNNFKARVYPLESKKSKTIVIAYEQELDKDQTGYVYIHPMSYTVDIDLFNFHLDVYQQELKPRVNEGGSIDLEFVKSDKNYTSDFSQKNFEGNENIEIELPISDQGEIIYTEKIPNTENDYYYYAIVKAKPSKAEELKPKSISIVWDASSSSSLKDVAKEYQLLKGFMEKNPAVTINLYVLRNELEKIETNAIVPGNWNSLKTALESIPLDGASAYKSIDFSTISGDLIFLLGDGLSNFGIPELNLGKTPIYTINSSPTANHSFLKYVSASTGGEYINLNAVKAEQAFDMLSSAGYHYFGNSIANSYPSIPTFVQDQITVSGIISGSQKVNFNFGRTKATDKTSIEIDPTKHITTSGLLKRIYAQKKLAQLDINYEENKEKIAELGKEFNIVTRNTSLIILDDVSDYVRHEITPPANLRKEYQALLKEKENRDDKNLKDHLKKVQNDFDAYVEWWKQDFSEEHQIALENKKKQEEEERKAMEREEQRRDSIIENGVDRTSIENVDETQGEVIEYEDGTVSISAVQLNSREIQRVPATAAEADIVGAFSVTPGVTTRGSRRGYSSGRRDKSKKSGENGTSASSINIEAWQPDAAYMDTMKNASKDDLYALYLSLKEEYGDIPSFYLDASDIFLEKELNSLALRVLSNVAEHELENHELLRVLAHRLEQLEYYSLAISTYEEVLELRKEEPQSYRDLGLCLAKDKQYQKAVDVLYKVVTQSWDNRFPGIETIVLTEINDIISMNSNVNTSKIEAGFIKELPVDVRVVLNWDADNCDMDLWVTDPNGEKCFYSNKDTYIGGHISNDFTGGYGPEVFNIKKSLEGEYKVQVDYFGTRSQRISGPTTIQVQLITNYGRPNQEVHEITRRLSTAKEILDIGTLVFTN